MLRPTNSYPHACPHWMHTVANSTTIDDMSPLNSKASLFYRGRCRDIYDYGYGMLFLDVHLFIFPFIGHMEFMAAVFPMGSRTSPGAFGAVPEILPVEVLKVTAVVLTLLL